eukprot:361663-Chlamydomonas_euryale.AAC.10
MSSPEALCFNFQRAPLMPGHPEAYIPGKVGQSLGLALGSGRLTQLARVSLDNSTTQLVYE